MVAKYTPEQAISAFHSHIDRSGGNDACWNWTGSSIKGYGNMRWRGGIEYAHRIAYELAYGNCPKDLDVLHTCDNPSCCNPRHLVLGTHLANMHDRDVKGRQVTQRGENHKLSKLTDVQVIEIRERYAKGNVQQAQLAREYGVSRSLIYKLVRNKQRLT